MKVSKFGGSSLANGVQMRRVLNIIIEDTSRKIIVVSAPGKRFETDIKVTDLLINYYHAFNKNKGIEAAQKLILDRFYKLLEELDLLEIFSLIENKIKDKILIPQNNPYCYDQFLSTGEDCSAVILASFLNKQGIEAKYMSPGEAGIIVTGDSMNAHILPQSYDKIKKLENLNEIIVIPGFFGTTLEGNLCTFSRGGSDITGAILAAGINAECYENFSDVDGIYVVNPDIIRDPILVEEVTFREMRELAYFGFTVIHEEALVPVAQKKVPMVLKNTNRPYLSGTKIVPNWTIEMPLVGITSSKGFVILKINKYMLYNDLSFVRVLFESLENLGIHFEAITTGIDDISILVKAAFLSKPVEEALKNIIIEKLKPDDFSIIKGLSIVAAVSEEIRQQTNITSRLTKVLSENNIKIETLMQGASEVSLLFVVKEIDENYIIKVLYKDFFENS